MNEAERKKKIKQKMSKQIMWSRKNTNHANVGSFSTQSIAQGSEASDSNKHVEWWTHIK